MILHVKGSNKAIRKLVESATRFYAEKLMGKRLTENLKITVNLKRNLLSKEGLEGSAVWNILLTLAHEMVHVKQWAKDEMYEYLNTIGMVRFKGEKVHLDSLEYWDQPWEIEAYGKQLGLFIRYCENMNFDREDMKEDA